MTERILVVDDEESNRELLDAILTAEGYTVEQAPDGPTALLRAGAAPPDLILLDVLMPEMNGIEVCQRLKQSALTEHVPVIVVTAVGQMTTKEAVLSSGADDFVTKPVQVDDLRARVRAMLKVRRIRQELDRTLAYLYELEATRREVHVGSPAQDAPRTAPDLPAERGAIAVLLVDDEILTREFYSELLSEHGFRVHTAGSGREGLALAAQHAVEVAILDIVMPEMSGLEVLEQLRASDPTLPIVMLTSHATSQNALTALKLGASDFIVKGLDHYLVLLAVHRAVRQRRESLQHAKEIARLRARVKELEARP
jgi:two-component system, cell cycle response regulator